MAKNNFNIIIVGLGGQGLITINKILAEAAFIDGLEVKTSELHGLSQRGGSVETSLRFGKRIYSPLIRQGGADLIISLEIQEGLRALYYTSKSTLFLINDFLKPIAGEKTPEKKEILKTIQKFSKKVILVPAADICKEKLGKDILAGVYLISLAPFNNLIPLKSSSILKAMKKIIPEKYLELNLKAFELAKDYNLSI